MTPPSWNDLDSFLTSRHQSLDHIANMKRTCTSVPKEINPSRKPNPHTPKNIHSHHAKVVKPAKMMCSCCPKQTHNLKQCPKFKAMSVQDRQKHVRTANLCFNCLSNSHMLKECTSTYSCAVCQQRHHSWLHFDNNSQIHAVQVQSTEPPCTSAQSTLNVHAQSFALQTLPSNHTVILGTANVLVSHKGTMYSARALLDSASEASFITEAFRKRLGIITRATRTTISGVDGCSTTSATKICNINLSSIYNEKLRVECNALVLPRITGNLPACSVDIKTFNLDCDLKLADEKFNVSAPVDLLIGGDLYSSVLLSGVQHNVFGSLIAQETIFGWILTGKMPINEIRTHATVIGLKVQQGLDLQLRKFWELEELPKRHFSTAADNFCENHFRKTTTRDDSGRFVVSLPFREEMSTAMSLGVSRPLAMRQYLRNEASLLRKPDVKKQYDSVVTEYLELDHMEPTNPPSNDHNSYYLPHHAVLKPESTTTSLRVVFNASFSSANGRSLNDMLHTGPPLQADLTSMLLKWRLFKFVFSSDITKMYRQIWITPEHRTYQRILHRSSTSQEVQDYQLKTVTFGVNCAPYLAIRVLHQLAQDVQQTHPLASRLIRHNMYVDDVLAGFHDTHTALTARRELAEALSSAGFQLRKWTANSKILLNDLPKEHLLDAAFLDFDDTSLSKALGMRWNAISDEFFFKAVPITDKSSFTKREVLSLIARLFDPAGWLAPVIVVAKIIMQRIWLDNTDWDEPLNEVSLGLWREFIRSYTIVNSIRIPRWTGITMQASLQIHGFCDASEKAYAGTIYVRVQQDEMVTCHLLTAKTKVAPTKTVSLPRLELCGALLLSNMLAKIIPSLPLPQHELFCWTDSTIVLAWLQKPPCMWKTFVASRVSKIQDNVGISCWRHVSGLENPADIASRGTTDLEFASNTLWWSGPTWLSSDPEHWPSAQTDNIRTEEEAKPIRTHVANVVASIEDILLRFSSYVRCLRVLSYMFRIRDRHLENPIRHDRVTISTVEILSTRQRIIRQVQQEVFADEFRSLRNKQPLSSKSKLRTLNPMLDEHGILRVNGRLVHSGALSHRERYPIILPYESKFSRLLVQFIHDMSLHGGNRLMLRLLRQEFWIPKAQTLIKAIVNSCKTCVLHKQRLSQQIMAALPAERCTLDRPFNVTGLDFAGPFDIKNYTGRACLITKGYVCVFVCFSTKAIHLEATSNLTTDAFLAAFARFVSRRGCPAHLHSDNGTTFVGASRILKREAAQALNTSLNAIEQRYAPQGLRWHFIPPSAPHMGGLWEAGVKSFKLHFRKIAGMHKYTFEELSTLLCRIEACLNSRPLCQQEEANSEFAPLTPGHFLIGAPLLSPPEAISDEAPVSIHNRWRRLKAISHSICIRWKNEYLKELHKRYKWKFPSKNLDIDDIVIIK